MSKKNKEGQSHGSMIEDPEVIIDKAEEFFKNDKNKNVSLIIAGVIAVVTVGWFFYRGQIESKSEEAQQEMFQAMYFYEQDSLGKALNGDGLNYGFLQIISDYSGTDAANRASFHAGHIYLQLGDYYNAIKYLSDFSSSDYVVQARAYSLLGDSHMELEQYAEAEDYYERAADYKANESYTPIYLQKLAIARENMGNYAEAAEAYETLIDEYVNHRLVAEAKKHKARLETLAN